MTGAGSVPGVVEPPGEDLPTRRTGRKPGRPAGPLAVPAFRRVWAAATVSSFGSYVTVLALQVIAAVNLRASGTGVGLLNAARWAPYLALGLFAGAVVDRHRRRPVLVGTNLGRAGLLCLIPLLGLTGHLSLPALLVVVAAFGVLSLFFDAADQAFLSRLLPAGLLTAGNARLQQSDSVAQSVGPLLAAALLRLVGAPLAILVDAASYLASALLVARARVTEPASERTARRHLLTEMRGGLSWVYRHRTLAPAALTSHLWFLSQGVLTTVYVLYVLRGHRDGGLGLSSFLLGVTYAAGGFGAVLGTSIAGRLGTRFEAGPVVIASHVLMPLAWLPVPLLVGGTAATPVLLVASQFLLWVGMGVAGPIELGYRQAVTPDRLQARVNITIRSFNRGSLVIGAPLGGLLADTAGYRVALWVGIAGFAGVALLLGLSPFRHASFRDAPTT